MKYKIFKNSPQGFMDAAKYKVTFYKSSKDKNGKPLLEVNYNRGYGGTEKYTLSSYTDSYLWTTTAVFLSCCAAKKVAEEFMEKENKIIKEAEKRRLEDQWSEVKC